MKSSFNRLVTVAYRLPFKFIKENNSYKPVQNSGGLVSAILALSEKFKDDHSQLNGKIQWVGTADNIPADISAEELANEHFDLTPVSIPQKTNDLFYGGFCNDYIWPLFHYFPTYCAYNQEYFDAYVEANRLFCDQLVPIIEPGDFVWIHDYQLMLLPAMLRERLPGATIGFFLHIPFPSFEIFRLMPRGWRERVVEGLLGADMVGFHTNDYAQHFLKSAKRTTGYDCKLNTINAHERIVKADAYPIGIDFEKFNTACFTPGVKEQKDIIIGQLKGQKLIFSVDRLDYSKGLLNRLRAYELFLEEHPEWHTRVVFNMVVVPSRDSIGMYRDMKKEIEYNVGRINGSFSSLSWRPIIYQYKSLSFDELVALYDMSDVGLITPLRDGMNLVAKEYVACQEENRGVLILSEMAGAAAELNEALVINPVDNVETAGAIFRALEMTDVEKEQRVLAMQKRISTYDVFAWAFDFMEQTCELKEYQAQMKVSLVNDDMAHAITKEFGQSRCRIIFLDYDGTLVPFTRLPHQAILPHDTRCELSRLADTPGTTIVIISGRDREFLEQQFEGISLTLVAEHGYFIRYPGEPWTCSVATNTQWKNAVFPILEEYVNRCHGSFIEEKSGSLSWHFRNVDSDFAQIRLNELRDDLADIIRQKTDFDILEGNKVLEVKSGKYNKGIAASLILSQHDYDFVMAVGDDTTDEDMFSSLPGDAVTIKIGNKVSAARYNLPDANSLLNLLKGMR